MFRRKRDDTRIDTIERLYGINLNARGDALLGNLLEDRGFDSPHSYWKRTTVVLPAMVGSGAYS